MSELHIDADALACAFNRLYAEGMDIAFAESVAQAVEKALGPKLDRIAEALAALYCALAEAKNEP